MQEKKSLLRFLTCGSVDDGKSTLIGRLLYDTKLIFEDQLADARARLQEARHDRRRHRFRAAGRRSRGRARAGHHHRRRLPLLRDAEAQVHRRRHAGPRAIHPQHGDRRLDGRSRRRADRCAPGRAAPDQAPFDHRLAARHPPRRARRQQDRSRRLRQGGLRRDRRGLRGLRAEPRLRVDRADPDLGALWRQCHQALGPDAHGIPARRCSSIWRRSSSTTIPAERAVPLSGAVCEPPQSRLPRLCRHDRVGLDRGRATRSSSPSPARPRGSSASSRMAATSRSAVAGQAVTLVLDDEVEVSRGNMLVSPARPAAGRRPVRRQHRLVRRDMRCCPAAPTSCAPRPTRPAPRSPTSSTGSTSTASRMRRPSRSR